MVPNPRTFAPGAAALLIGCASALYVEPSGVPTATLRLENQGPPVFGYELEVFAYEDALACRGRVRLAPRPLTPGIAHSVRVAAGIPFAFALRATGGGAARADNCTLAGSFTPRAGERYIAIFRLPQGKCDLLFVHQEAAPGSGRRYVDDATYRPRNAAECLSSASAPSSTRVRADAPPPPPALDALPAPHTPPR
jgi:hypothetical protein